jgi:hypothetical protein
LITIEVSACQGQQQEAQRNQTDEEVEGDAGGEKKPMISIELFKGSQEKAESANDLFLPMDGSHFSPSVTGWVICLWVR